MEHYDWEKTLHLYFSIFSSQDEHLLLDALESPDLEKLRAHGPILPF